MPVKFEFTGKELVENAHEDVPVQELKIVHEKSLTANPCLDDNLIIHGDNLQSLKSLLPKYAGKVKCIYIDPPYNTGNNFIYKDNANNTCIQNWLINHPDIASKMDKHDKWLCMMYPRLKLLHELLADDGVIFISIDENEQAHLKMLCDEVFGEESYVGDIIWKNRITPNDSKNNFAFDHEMILIYAKRVEHIIFRGVEKDLSNYRNPDNDPNGSWIRDNPSAASGNYNFEILNPYTNELYRPPMGRFWAFSEKRISEWQNIGKLVFPKENNTSFILKKYLSELKSFYKPVSSIIDKILTANGTKELKNIFAGQSPFKYPKPSSLVAFLIKQITKENDIILDSFAGSGTTAHAVLDLNKEDGGNRKFILIECEDYADTITAERVRRVIKGVPNAKDPKLKAGLGGSFTYCELGDA